MLSKTKIFIPEIAALAEAFCTDTVAVVDTVVVAAVAVVVEDTIVGCILDDALDHSLVVGVAHNAHSTVGVGQIHTFVVGDPVGEYVADSCRPFRFGLAKPWSN